jgi:ATP-dependent Lon protease
MAETELVELDKKIQAEIREKAEKAQKDYFLREQMKLIRRELGEEKDPRSLELKRLEAGDREGEAARGGAQARAREELTRCRRRRSSPANTA